LSSSVLVDEGAGLDVGEGVGTVAEVKEVAWAEGVVGVEGVVWVDDPDLVLWLPVTTAPALDGVLVGWRLMEADVDPPVISLEGIADGFETQITWPTKISHSSSS